MNVPLPSGAAIHTIAGMASITSRISLSARRTESSRGGFMSLAVRLFVIDYAFIHSSGKKRQQNFPPRSVFFWVLMVSWRVTGNIVIRRSLCPLRLGDREKPGADTGRGKRCWSTMVQSNAPAEIYQLHIL